MDGEMDVEADARIKKMRSIYGKISERMGGDDGAAGTILSVPSCHQLSECTQPIGTLGPDWSHASLNRFQ